MQIATVFDGGSNVISHYMNGTKVGEEQIPEEFIPEKVEIGSASIGNWSEPRYRKTPEFAIRNLNGKMDELAGSKKESSRMRRELMKLNRNLSGMADMDKLPAALVVVDVVRESIAVQEARRLGIPVVAIVDSRHDVPQAMLDMVDGIPVHTGSVVAGENLQSWCVRL